MEACNSEGFSAKKGDFFTEMLFFLLSLPENEFLQKL